MRRPLRFAAAALLLALVVPCFARAGTCAANQQLRILSAVAPRPAPDPVTYADFGQAGCATGGAANTNFLAPFATHVRVRAIAFPRSVISVPSDATIRFDNSDPQPLDLEWNASMQTWDATVEISDARASVTASVTLENLDNVAQRFTVTYMRSENGLP